MTTPLDHLAASRTVFLDGAPWVAQWGTPDEAGSTLVSFIRVRTDPSMPDTALPDTTAPITTSPTIDTPPAN